MDKSMTICSLVRILKRITIKLNTRESMHLVPRVTLQSKSDAALTLTCRLLSFYTGTPLLLILFILYLPLVVTQIPLTKLFQVFIRDGHIVLTYY